VAVKVTEARISRMQKDGLGRGAMANYRPWVAVTDFSSSGRSRRVWSPKTQRTHHLLSDVEYNLFVALEWSHDVVDVREQYPFDRDVTQDVARKLGIKHPCYPGSAVPTVMTADFMVTRIRKGVEVYEVYDAKRTEEAEDERSLLKLEIARNVCELLGACHHLVFHDDIPLTTVRNIDWIRDSVVKPDEKEPRPGYWAGMSARMASVLAAGGVKRTFALAEFCADFDAKHGAEPGVGLRTARLLMWDRVLQVDLTAEHIEALPMSELVVTAHPGQLRVVGGG
jgi:hypothetical protein